MFCFLLQGGGWCNNVKTCVYRKTTRRGSSKYMEKQIAFTGLLSNKPEENPGVYCVFFLNNLQNFSSGLGLLMQSYISDLFQSD